MKIALEALLQSKGVSPVLADAVRCLVAENEALKADVLELVGVLDLIVSTFTDGGWPSATMVVAKAALTKHKEK